MSGVDSSTTRIQPGPASGPRSDRLDLPIIQDCLHTLRGRAAAHARSLGMAPDRIGNLMVVVSELATNAIRHGGGTGRLTVWRQALDLYCRVRDHGTGIRDPHAGSTRPDLIAAGGRGLWICRQLCSDLVISCPDGQPGTTVTAVMAIGGFQQTEGHPHSHSDEPARDTAAQPRPAGARDARQDHHTRSHRPRRASRVT
jgi:anti-sigma regulatory factor (Ser/Thr protein kinase)